MKSLRPDPSLAGAKSKTSDDARVTWFGPVGEPSVRFRYGILEEEGDLLSVLPGEGRFKKGLKAVRYGSEEAEEGELYVVLKTRPSRIDLRRAGEG